MSRSAAGWRSPASRPSWNRRAAGSMRLRLIAGHRQSDSGQTHRLSACQQALARQTREPEMRGRRPKPTRLKVLTGNPGKRPLNAAELTPEPAIPDCPAELGPVARREWDRLVVELASLRLLTNLDRAALAAYCGSYALWAESMEAIQKYGTM